MNDFILFWCKWDSNIKPMMFREQAEAQAAEEKLLAAASLPPEPATDSTTVVANIRYTTAHYVSHHVWCNLFRLYS